WIAYGLSVPGFALLAAAMVRHADALLGQRNQAGLRRGAQLAGSMLLAVALAVCAHAYGMSVGIAVWLGVLTLAAANVGVLLTYAAHRLVTVAGVFLFVVCLAAMLRLAGEA